MPSNGSRRTFAVTYTYVPDIVERRQPYRPEHLEHLGRARDDGRLLLAGPYTDPVDGALLVAEGDNPGDVLAWVADDPYARAGLIRAVSIREITVAIAR